MTFTPLAEAAVEYAVAERPDVYALTPTRLALLTGLRMALAGDAAALRAIGRLEEAMGKGEIVVTSFDGVEGRCASVSRGAAVEHVFTADGCTCEGGRHPWHTHRVLFRLMLAEWALYDPAALQGMLTVPAPPAGPPAVEPPPPGDDERRPWANDAAYQAFYESEFGR